MELQPLVLHQVCSLMRYTDNTFISPLSDRSFILRLLFIRLFLAATPARVSAAPSRFPLSARIPFARCDIALIEQKHVERSDISQGISRKTGSLCDWQPVFGAKGLLGMNVVSVTLDPVSC